MITRSQRGKRWGDFAVSVISAAAALIIAGWALLPLITISFVSFTSRMGLTEQREYVGVSNFDLVIRDPSFLRALWNTVLYGTGSTIGQVLFGVLLATIVWSWPQPVARVLRVLFYLPYLITPTVVAVIVWRFLGDSDVGLITLMGKAVGLPVQLFSPEWISGALVLISIWIFAPFTMIMVLARLEQIPRGYFEVVYMEGGGAIAAFRYVVLPEILPVVISTAAFRLVVMASKFDVPYLVLGSGRLSRVYGPASIYIYDLGYQQLLYGQACAAAVLLSLLVLVPSILLIGQFRRVR